MLRNENILLDHHFFACFRFVLQPRASVASLFFVSANYLVFDIPIFSRSAMRTLWKCFIKRREMSETKRQLRINTSAITYTRWLTPWQDYIGSLNHWCSRIECSIIIKVATGFSIFLLRHCTFICIYSVIQNALIWKKKKLCNALLGILGETIILTNLI